MPAKKNVSLSFREFLLKWPHYQYRFETKTIHSMLKPYRRAKNQIYDRLVSLEKYGTGFSLDFRVARLKAQLAEVQGVLNAAALQSAGILEDGMKEIALLDSQVYHNMLDKAYGPLGIDIVRLPYRHIDHILSNPLLGERKIADELLWTNQKAIGLMKRELTQSIIQGEDMARAAKRLVKPVAPALIPRIEELKLTVKLTAGEAEKLIWNKAQIVARTEIQHVSNRVARGIYNENQDVLRGVQFVSTLDSRTCLLPETIVNTKEGEKRIKDVKVGDLVLSHKGNWRRILGKMKTKRDRYLKVKLSNGKILKITSDHLVLKEERWIEVRNLKLGDAIDGKNKMTFEEIEILSVEEVIEEVEVYDIAVEEDHSFLAEGVFVHNCIRCGSLDGKIYQYKEGVINAPIIPLHPYCFIDHQIPIFTSRGMKSIGKIEVGDRVLTHKGRFRKVTDIIRHKVKGPEVVTVEVEFPRFNTSKVFRPGTRKLTVTTDHPLMIDGEWQPAKEIKVGDMLRYLAAECKRCGKLIPYNRKHCSQSCLSKDVTDKQWTDPEHRKNMSEKISAKNIEQYASGERNRYSATVPARRAVAKMFYDGIHPFQTNPQIGERNPSKRPEVRIQISESKKGDKNCMVKYPHLRLVYGRKMRKFFKENPDKHPNRVMARKGFESSLEKKFREMMEARGLTFTKQHPIVGYFVDFAIPKLKIAIEVDGDYWHQNKEKDQKRQKEIEDQGWLVLRYSESEVNSDVGSCVDELCRVMANHNGEYKYIELKVVSVKHWISTKKGGKTPTVTSTTLYNFSVEDDESYIANGFVSHNCRCVLAPISKSWKELGDKVTKEVPPSTRASFAGPVPSTLAYPMWLKQLDDPASAIYEAGRAEDILGPTRYGLWKKGKLKLNQMATDRRILTIDKLKRKAKQITKKKKTKTT